MKKSLKKIITVVLTFAMMFAMTVPAYAKEAFKISVKGQMQLFILLKTMENRRCYKIRMNVLPTLEKEKLL